MRDDSRAVRLANTASYREDGGDGLTTMEGLHALVADQEHLCSSTRAPTGPAVTAVSGA